MSVVTRDNYLKGLLQGQSQLSASPLERLNRLRANAVGRVSTLRMPTKSDEEWRFTDISPLTKMSFQPMRTASPLQISDVEHFYLAETVTRLVFVDGVYAPHLSTKIPDVSKRY